MDCSPASIRAVNDFPCNAEDVFLRESDAKWKVWCNNGVRRRCPCVSSLKTPVLQSDVLSSDDSTEAADPCPWCRETSVWARVDKWTCPCHFYFHFMSRRTALKQYPLCHLAYPPNREWITVHRCFIFLFYILLMWIFLNASYFVFPFQIAMVLWEKRG